MAKVRVYELAKELGVESKTVLSMLKDMGEFVRSASSTVEAPVERRLKEKLASEPPPVKKAPAKKAAAKKADGEQATSAPAPADVPVEVPAATAPTAPTAAAPPAPAEPATPAAPAVSAPAAPPAAPSQRPQPTGPQPTRPPANGSSASRRAPSSRTGCASRSDRRATDYRAAATSRFHRRTSWRSGRTATRHPAARKQPLRALTRNGSVASAASRSRRHRTCWSAPACGPRSAAGRSPGNSGHAAT